MKVGDWFWSIDHRQACLIVDVQSLWEETLCRVWLPTQDIVIQVRADQLRPLDSLPESLSIAHLKYLTAAARVADAMTQRVILAPIESSVIPLPHQIRALSRAVSHNRVRYLLADEVGLGKTIEAGLIMRELKLRGLVRRTLVIAPRGLVAQWIAEMRIRLGEEFRLLVPGDIPIYRKIAQDENIWRSFHQIVCPMDSVKPLDSSRGWSREQVAEYNRERFEDLIAAGWDLVIVDEAHRLAGSTEQVARYKLGQGLAEAAPYFLLLSATPHQGKTDAFHRLVSLLDGEAFPDAGSISKDRVQPYVIRTEKRQAIDAQGKPLFKPRQTQLVPISWEDRHFDQRSLYEEVTEYVRKGYNQAVFEKKTYIGFLMILMQRLVTSSIRAIATTLARRLEALEMPEEQLSLFPMDSEEEWTDLDGQDQVEMLLTTALKALKDEHAEVKVLLEAAKSCESVGSDAKAEALLSWIYRLQQEEADPDLKVLVFTEFVPTQEMLQKYLSDRGFTVVCLNGSMDMEERKRAQDAFAREARVLISTDAGGEGLNLQFCHVVINYDIPWNPMKLEQRIGRVDRIGQTHPVRAVNFVFEDTVEHRVREVLEEKLAIILNEFGIDKTGDVLDSAQAGQIFDELYIKSILKPEELDIAVETAASQIREQARLLKENMSILGAIDELDPNEAQRLMAHPLPHWVERMTVNFLEAYGGTAEKQGQSWNLIWPDGEKIQNVVFNVKDAEEDPNVQLLTLEDTRIRDLAMQRPRFAPGQPIPAILLSDLPGDVRGFWSLWRIAAHTKERDHQRIMPLFLHDDGRCLAPTARHIWDQLLTVSPEICGHIEGEEAQRVLERMTQAAEIQGKPIYDELLQMHRGQLIREREKGEYAFTARRRAVERIGLPAVRNYRLSQIAQEELSWREQLENKVQVSPEMVPLLLIRLDGGFSRGQLA